jgi:hypothetical protein
MLALQTMPFDSGGKTKRQVSFEAQKMGSPLAPTATSKFLPWVRELS